MLTDSTKSNNTGGRFNEHEKIDHEYSQSHVKNGDSGMLIIVPRLYHPSSLSEKNYQNANVNENLIGSKELAFEFSGLNNKLINNETGQAFSEHDYDNLRFSWLMSFPNSGTSYTLKMVAMISQRSTATNYGKEEIGVSGNSMTFGSNYLHGPFRSNAEYPLPDGYILTKTHCGGRCTFCHPNRYIESEWSFMQECLTGHREILYDNEIYVEKKVYNEEFIKRAIHLIRNPFDNIVSRFHLQWNHRTKLNDNEWLETYPRSANGFQKWCRDADLQFISEESNSHYRNIPNLHVIPCHAELFKYTQWHNRAFQVIEKMNIPSLIVHYEDYDENFNKTMFDIASFLELDVVSDPPKYLRTNYDDHYTEKQQRDALKMIKSLATKATWDILESRYNFLRANENS